MCNIPVTLGGGIMIAYGSRVISSRLEATSLEPIGIPARFNLFWFVGFCDFCHTMIRYVTLLPIASVSSQKISSRNYAKKKYFRVTNFYSIQVTKHL